MASPEHVDTICKACAYAAFDKLKQLVGEDPDGVNRPDAQGYYPLQWAALNNSVQEATFLISHGADVHAVDGNGQTALHWASFRGALPVIEILLRNSADLEAKDKSGYTTCHIAAQHGQTAVIYYLAIRWNANIDIPDNEGHTPAHWAAYKGMVDALRLLLVLDANFSVQDRDGCTPLHWAAIKGHGEACTVLLQAGAHTCLNVKDATGSTPAELAMEKGHRYLALHLSDFKPQGHAGDGYWFGKNGKLSWLTSMQLCPFLWLLILALLFVFVYKILPESKLNTLQLIFVWSCVGAASLGLGFLYLTTTVDPGLIPTGWDRPSREIFNTDSTSLLRGHVAPNLDSPALWAGDWHQLCVTCRIVRPLRAKHCNVTGRCIEVFDHYCPWVGNAVAKRNRHYFLVFLWLEVYSISVAAGISLVTLQNHVASGNFSASYAIWVIAFIIFTVSLAISTAALAIAQASQIIRNATTNELANWHRYRYLQDAHGNFNNPFSHGWWNNCVEAFHPDSTPTAPVILSGSSPASEHRGNCCSKSI